ncbi:MAG: (d)CMP kinase [Hyphomicrobiales bacterium]
MADRNLAHRPGRRVAVYGPSGSGKSTISREIGRRLGLPVIELDAVYHGPNWQDLDRETFRERVRELLAAHPGGWVFDGNYSIVRDLILPHADTVVWLRLPFLVVYPRLAWRTVRRAATGRELWNGNREEWRMLFSKDSMLLWGLTAWRRTTRNTGKALRTIPHQATVVQLRSPREVSRWLARLPDPVASGGLDGGG